MKAIINLLSRMGKLESAVLYLFVLTLAVWIANSLIKAQLTSYLLTISLLLLLIASAALFVLSLKALLGRRKAKATVRAKKRK